MRRGTVLTGFVLLMLLLAACGTPDSDVVVGEPEPSTEQVPEEPTAAEPAPAEPETPEPAETASEETEPVPGEPPAEPVPEQTEGLTAEGLPITEARAKAAQYYQNPGTGFGFISVTSDPPGAAVVMDSERIGNTPITKWRGKVKMYLLRVDLSGYDTYQADVYLKDNQTINVMVNLSSLVRSTSGITTRSREGTLELTTNAEGATIFIDNRFSDTAPRTISLSPGTHELKLRKLGYKEYVQTFTITTGKTTKLHVNIYPS